MNICRIFYKIKEFPSHVKHVYQRAKKGYSYKDVWNIDYWFMEIIPKMLADYKKNLHGCPSQFTNNEDGTEYQDIEKGMKDWETILERMIFCFKEMNEDTCSMKNEYEEEYHKQHYGEGKSALDCFVPYEDERYGKVSRLVTKEVEPELEKNYWDKIREIEDYREKMKNEGLELFSKYFWNLWD